MIRRLVLALGLLLACSAPAWATPAYVQSGNCGGSKTTCTLTGPPTNGDIVEWFFPNAAAIGSVTVTDSNGRLLNEHQPSGNCVSGNALCVAIFDYVVSGSPTATYTVSGITAYDNGCVGDALATEIRGAVYGSAVYTTTNAATYTAPLVNTIFTVAIHDYQAYRGFCMYPGAGLASSNSNGAQSNDGQFVALAALTTSSTATASLSTAGAIVNIYVDYPALAKPTGVFPYPGVFQPALYHYRGDPIFEMLARG